MVRHGCDTDDAQLPRLPEIIQAISTEKTPAQQACKRLEKQIQPGEPVRPELDPRKRLASWGLGASGLRFRAVDVQVYAGAKRPGSVLRKRAWSVSRA
jgi:hypothetical protein